VLALTASTSALAGKRPAIVQVNRAIAQALAQRLISSVVLPNGEGLTGPPEELVQSPALMLDRPFSEIASGNLIDLHEFWRLEVPSADFATFARAHVPAGTSLFSSGQLGGPGSDHEQELDWSYQHPSAAVGTAWLEYSFVRLGAEATGLRLDTLVVWLPPRTEATLVPSSDLAATISLDSLAPSVGSRSLSLGAGRQLSLLIQLVDRLRTVAGASVGGCVMVTTSFTITFSSDAGSPASAKAIAQIGCYEFNLKIGDHQILLWQPPLDALVLSLFHLTRAQLSGLAS
jgi:hypothetical protein